MQSFEELSLGPDEPTPRRNAFRKPSSIHDEPTATRRVPAQLLERLRPNPDIDVPIIENLEETLVMDSTRARRARDEALAAAPKPGIRPLLVLPIRPPPSEPPPRVLREVEAIERADALSRSAILEETTSPTEIRRWRVRLVAGVVVGLVCAASLVVVLWSLLA